MSNESKEIKVTDKRMFTPDGKLREEYRFLDEKSTAPEPQAPAAEPEPAAAPPAPRAPTRKEAAAADPAPAAAAAPARRSSRQPPPPPPPEAPPRLELPDPPPGMGPSFYDLVAVLAESVALYLGDVELPDGQDAENLEMARLHLDLLDILRQKTSGNLSAQESAFLEDLLYRLRVRYVQKRG
ncbi:MAG TPA: DUF1844 domain-containing protein [Thermoanaerobaculia bacterium]|nr:DUF1844 domain-containing protein [Thermoanaerobaculia bacterium]